MDVLSPDERAAIDEAVSAGRVEAVPEKPTKERRGREPCPKVALRRKIVAQDTKRGKTPHQIAEAIGVKVQTVYNDIYAVGLSRGGRKQSKGDVAALRKAGAAKAKSARAQDRRRFKTVPVPMGDPSTTVAADARRTLFPGRVFEPDPGEPLLKDGCNAAKIGGDVLVGWLKGARIYTLTLEERATCPRACAHWQSCYGNSMPHARRWRHGPALIAQLDQEIAALCNRHERILIRLHVLGDFWSVEYVEFWSRALERHPNLFVFGFTAHKQGTEIGDYIAAVRGRHPDRFWMRHSDVTGPWGTFTVDFPTAQKRIGDAVVCPEQRDGMEGSPRGTHCGNCGVCWASPVPIAFVTH
ncbi:hypothetical protein [Roseovarius nitratireducens]|uniref:hypothetical protein n=1 Tax=Roseovarius nitratireducens TaxID=2044597 RepID=UPI000CE2646C|nr:hypothetical protein [Roseovarius nitratireducens]